MSEWLMLTALDLGIRGTTVMTGSEGYGHKRYIRSSRYFEPPDKTQEIVMIVNEEEADNLFDYLQKEGVQLFYVRMPVVFGMLCKLD